MLTIVNNLRLTTEQKKDVDIIIHAIKNHINGLRNKSLEWYALCWQSQQPGETFDNYLVALRELAKTCNFCSEECAQKSIRDQIIKGISNGDTIKHLLWSPKLTSDTPINTCRVQEVAKRQCRETIEQSPGAILSIKQPQHKTKQPTYSNSPTQPNHTCPRCGQEHTRGDTSMPCLQSTEPILP